jgi:hypothetical protein
MRLDFLSVAVTFAVVLLTDGSQVLAHADFATNSEVVDAFS